MKSIFLYTKTRIYEEKRYRDSKGCEDDIHLLGEAADDGAV